MIRKLVVLAAVAGGWWLLHRPGQLDPRQLEVTRIVALSGAPLAEAMAAGRCGELTDELVRHPNWSLGVTDARADCSGWHALRTYEIHADGTMTFTQQGLSRTLQLDPGEVGLVRDIGRLDCNAPIEHHGDGGSGLWISPGVPALIETGAYVPSRSVYAETLVAMLERAVARWTEQRLREITPLALDLRAGKYRIALDDHTLVVRRHGHVLEERRLTDEALVDLVDTLITRPLDPGRGRVLVAGHLRTDGVAYPVRLGWGRPDAASVVFSALDDAKHAYGKR